MKLRIRARARTDIDAILEHSVAEHGKARAETCLRAIDAALERYRILVVRVLHKAMDVERHL